jgi:hypothetical protein
MSLSTAKTEAPFQTPWEVICSLPTTEMSEGEIVAEIKKYFPDFNPLPPDEWFAQPS